MHGRTTGKHELIRLTTAWTWGKPPPSPLYYSLCLATSPTPKCHLSQDSQIGSPKILEIGTPTTLEAHNFLCWPPIEVRSETKFYPHRRLSKDMWHAIYMQVNQGDSRLLMVGNQIGNLTPSPSFGHNLCFKYPNRPYKPILNIHVSRAFQWYKELFNLIRFDLYNHLLNIRKSIKTLTFKVGAHLGVCGFIPSHFPTLLGTWNVTSRFHYWPAPLQALALVESLKLRLWQDFF